MTAFVSSLFIAVLSAMYNHIDFATIASRMISIIVAFFIVNFYTKKQYISIFNKVVYFIAVIAIITEVVAYTILFLFNLFPTVTNTANITFSYFFIGSMRYTFLVTD